MEINKSVLYISIFSFLFVFLLSTQNLLSFTLANEQDQPANLEGERVIELSLDAYILKAIKNNLSLKAGDAHT